MDGTKRLIVKLLLDLRLVGLVSAEVHLLDLTEEIFKVVVINFELGLDTSVNLLRCVMLSRL
jgi:hypothetical protein